MAGDLAFFFGCPRRCVMPRGGWRDGKQSSRMASLRRRVGGVAHSISPFGDGATPAYGVIKRRRCRQRHLPPTLIAAQASHAFAVIATRSRYREYRGRWRRRRPCAKRLFAALI